MVFVGKKIAYFFKPLVENTERLIVVCLTADNNVLFKWGKNLKWIELFCAKSLTVYKRANKNYRIKELHAKIYCFDDRIFLSSANLTYNSMFKNIEHAIEVTKKGEKEEILKYLDKLRDEA